MAISSIVPIKGQLDKRALKGKSHRRPKRPPIAKAEQRRLDLKCARRLERSGRKPWLNKQTRLVGMTVDLEIDLLPLRESWLFSKTAKQRAARFVAEFCAFQEQADTSNYWGYVLRPKKGKAELGGLEDAIKSLNKQYDRALHLAKKKGYMRPVACFLHIRYDIELGLWDLHLHCIFDVNPSQAEDLRIFLAMKFATATEIEDRSNIGAWANYSSGWAVNHRDLKKWPETALMEFDELESPRLFRKGGDFKEFSRTLKNQKYRWESDKVIFEEKTPRRTAGKGLQKPSSNDGVVGYQYIQIDGQKELFAIVKLDRQEDGVSPFTEPTEKKPTTNRDARPRAEKPTINTGSIPPAENLQNRTSIANDIETLSGRDQRRVARWCRIWPYGRSKTRGRTVSSRTRNFPRPVERRIVQRLIGSTPP